MITIKEAEEILKKEYHVDNFLYVVDELLLPDFRADKHDVDFKNSIFTSVQQLGYSDKCDVNVYEVILNEGAQNRRVTITQEMFRILRGLGVNNAIVAFSNADRRNYRFSLLTSKYEFDGEKVVKVLSNPRRYSYSLGYGTKTKTAYDFLIGKGRVNSLDELINRFSVEVVNKQFYNEIALAFTKLVGGQRDGKSFEKELNLYGVTDQNKYAEFAVRLIGRIVFCWFLKEKKSENGIPLIPESMLALDSVKASRNYYHDTLEPLFFELLNTNQPRRKGKFAREEIYTQIPYLNGGLFSPHADDHYKFAPELQAGQYGLVTIPNGWFEHFFEILGQYNFTVDENTSYDIELSIDPEMLGRIFENLLAEISQENGENAKKSTGSFYTPRDIVGYMVDSSILEYLKTKTTIDEAKLRALISYGKEDDELAAFDKNEKKQLINALYTVTIIDPACGSGAFPIGMLQKIVYMLQEIDPEANLWFDKATENVSILIKKEFEKKFNAGSLDYIRKLSVIQNSIFGVDIQPIAVEIARLRCFLSLVIEEKVYDDEPNRGINPLPSLDFKFIIANSLVALEESPQLSLFENQDHIDELRAVRDEYFNADTERKTELKLEFADIQKRMFQETISNYNKSASSRYKALSDWSPFSNESTSWFDAEWMFGIKDGFDIVIGNPPYGLLNKKQNQKSSIQVTDKEINYYKTFPLYAPAKGGMLNIYRLFICQSHHLLKANGHMSLIFPMAFMCDLSAAELRKFVFAQESIQYLETFPERDDENKRVFQSAKMSVCILGSNRTKSDATRKFKLRINDNRYVNTSYEQVDISPSDIDCIDSKSFTIPLVSKTELDILLKMCENSKRMKEFSKCFTGEIDISLDKKYIRLDNSYHTMLRGAQIQRFYTTNDISQGDILYLDSEQYLAEVASPRSRHHLQSRIVMQGITGVNEKYRLKMTLSEAGTFCANSVNYLLINEDIEYFLGLCNSSLINWFFKKLSTNSNVNGYEVDNLPIIVAQDDKKEQLKNIVKSLLSGSREHSEDELNAVVYDIYGLTDEEIVVVEATIK